MGKSGSERETVLLFYKDFDRPLREFEWYAKRLVKPLYSCVPNRPTGGGFTTWFDILAVALAGAGCRVRVNDTRFARAHRKHPVGPVGCYRHLLDGRDLPDPAMLGTSLLDHPPRPPT